MKTKKIIHYNVGILGYGEIGKAVAKFYRNPRIKDITRDDGLKGIEILNVCIPYSDDFVKIVKNEIKINKPRLVIIHSTVLPNTTKKISKGMNSVIVHSPVRGVHPHLHKGIKTFVKYIGADSKKAGDFANRHLRSLGIKTKLIYPSTATELGKLLDTTYYGLCIAWHGEMEKICKKFKVDFSQTINDFNITYNEGYSKLGKKDVIRPVLNPPQKYIGGHCVIPNTELLKKIFNSKYFDLILEYKK